MSEINLEAACQLFETQVTLQYQNRLKLQDTIEERHGLHGTHLNIPMSDLVEMNQTHFSPTDINVTPVNETNIQVPTTKQIKDYMEVRNPELVISNVLRLREVNKDRFIRAIHDAGLFNQGGRSAGNIFKHLFKNSTEKAVLLKSVKKNG